MAYAYTPDDCPTKHYNPGDDICSDCGLYLNGPADGVDRVHEPEAPPPPPETRNVCVISTAHLTAATILTLAGPRAGWPIYGGAYGPEQPDGFFVHVAEPGDDELSDDLVACCAWAKSFSPPFDYIMFDADADARPDLPTYEH